MRPPEDSFDVVLVTTELTPHIGGTERQIVLLANALDEDNVRVAVLSRNIPSRDVGLRSGVVWLGWGQCADGSATTAPAGAARRASAARRAGDALVRRTARTMRTCVPGLVRSLRRLEESGSTRRERSGLLSAGRALLHGIVRASWSSKVIPLQRSIESLAPATVMSFLTWPSVLVAAAVWDLPVRFVASYRGDLRRQFLDEPMRSLEYLTGVRGDLVTANSAATLEVLSERPEIADSRLRLAPNIMGPAIAGAGDASRFIHLGRLVPRKNADVALRAFAAISGEFEGWGLIMAGEGPQRPQLELLAAELGVSARVRFLGFVGDVSGLLSAGGVQLSIGDHEGTPNAVLEAMAHGIPVIITDTSPGQIGLVVGGEYHEDAGLLVPPRDHVATAHAMSRLAADPDLRRELGAAGRRRAAGRSWQDLAPVWREILALT